MMMMMMIVVKVVLSKPLTLKHEAIEAAEICSYGLEKSLRNMPPKIELNFASYGGHLEVTGTIKQPSLPPKIKP